MHDAVPNLPSTDAPLTQMRSKGALFALTPLFVVSAAWSALSFWLFVDGQQPSGPSVFSPAAHYLWQAVLLPMAVVFSFVGAEKVVKAIARLTRDEVIGIRFPLAVALATAQLLGIVLVMLILETSVARGDDLPPAGGWPAPKPRADAARERSTTEGDGDAGSEASATGGGDAA